MDIRKFMKRPRVECEPTPPTAVTPPSEYLSSVEPVKPEIYELRQFMTAGLATTDEDQSNLTSPAESSITSTVVDTIQQPEIQSAYPTTVDLFDISSVVANGPVQPIIRQFKKTKIGADWRCFNSHWYQRFPTLEYSISRDAVFCFTCRHFKPRTGNAEVSFTENGYRNWKKLGEKMEQHIQSLSHVDSVAQWNATKDCQQTGSVIVHLSSQNKTHIQRNRSCVASIVRTVIFCARQDIALRGHRESPMCDDHDLSTSSTNRGNFRELIDLLKLENSETRSKLESLPKNANYTSKESQNEILHAAASLIREHIIQEINEGGGIYSVIADEARDNSCTEKMSVCVRYLHDTQIKERFLGFIDVHQLDARSLASSMATFLQNTAQLSLKNCVGQSYDGASVMSGEKAGVQEIIRQGSDYPCPYVHCYAHKLNLVLVDVAKSVRLVHQTFGLFEAIYAFQSVSTLRHAIFMDSQKGETRILNIPQQSDTRWVCKYKGVTFFKSRFNCVIAALERLSASKNAKEGAEARGLLNQFKTFNVVFILCLFEDLLGLTNSLSMLLQTSSIDFGSCARVIEATVKTLSSKRSDSYFEIVWKSTTTLCSDAHISFPTTRSTVQPPERLSDYICLTTFGRRETSSDIDEQTQHKIICFEIIDQFLSELQKRFSGNNYVLEAAIATDPKHPLFLSFDLMSEFANMHELFGINTTQLKCQVEVARNMFQSDELKATPASGEEQSKHDLPSSSVSNASHVLARLLPMAPAFPDLLKFFKLILCMPVSSASAERSFSTMKRIKSYLRGSMNGERLSDLAMISIEREISNNLLTNPMLVVDRFATSSHRRLLLH